MSFFGIGGDDHTNAAPTGHDGSGGGGGASAVEASLMDELRSEIAEEQ